MCTSCLNHFTDILPCKSRCKQCVHLAWITSQIYYPANRGVSSVYIFLESLHRYITLQIACKQCVYILLESLHRYIILQIKLCTIIAEILPCECCSKLFSRWWNDFYVSWKVKVKSNHYRPWNDFTLTFWRNEKSKSSCENNFVVHTSCLNTLQRYCLVMMCTHWIHTEYTLNTRCIHTVYTYCRDITLLDV